MHICFITYAYPGKHNSSDFAFVKQLVDAIASQNNYCTVVAPFNILHYKKLSISKEEYSVGKGKVKVLRPGYISFSNFSIGGFSLSTWAHKKAVKKALHSINHKPDAIYGHFWNSAYEGYVFAKKNHIPLFVASGESEIRKLFSPKKDQAEFRDYVSGVICVSSKNRDESIEMGLATPEKCRVFPNAVNANLFRKLDKTKCRELLGVPKDVFILAFVGWFIDRKGPRRVVEAINNIESKEVYSLFIGRGEQEPICDNILFKGTLPHDKIPLYLNAADVFVLPTLSEGCCNAVVEAMACGLPIISSNMPFNWDVLDESNSIMIDPNNVDEITEAIKRLLNDSDLRSMLSEGALKKAESLTIDNRAQSILTFIKSKV